MLTDSVMHRPISAPANMTANSTKLPLAGNVAWRDGVLLVMM
jgi:hypothetical protein